MEYKGAKPVTQGFETARRGAGRFVLPLIGGMIVFGLAGCSGQTASLDTGPAVMTPQVQPTKPIAFAPIIGAPGKVSRKLNEMLTAAAAQKSMPVVPSKEADYTIRGYLVAAADPKGTKLSYIWDITDKGGKRAKRFQGNELIEGKKGGNAWSTVDDAALQRVAAKTTDELLAWLPRGDATAGGTTAASTGTASAKVETPKHTASTGARKPAVKSASTRSRRPRKAAPKSTGTVLAAAQTAQTVVAVVQPVRGAPGDGVTSLTDAMKRHLQQAGVALTDKATRNAYVVRGTVQLDKASGGQQPITIRWIVVGPNGRTMEKAVVQRNKVPEGSLNGAWGQTADLAAGEAARSVAKLIGNRPAG